MTFPLGLFERLVETPWRAVILSEPREIWCLVDEVDFPWVVEWRWNWGWHVNTRWKFYAKRNIGGARSTVYLHREVLRRADPRSAAELVDLVGDHINGQSLDNRRANLRWATKAENGRNRLGPGLAPTLEQIVVDLLASPAAAKRRELANIPF